MTKIFIYHAFKRSNVYVVGCKVWTCLKWVSCWTSRFNAKLMQHMCIYSNENHNTTTQQSNYANIVLSCALILNGKQDLNLEMMNEYWFVQFNHVSCIMTKFSLSLHKQNKGSVSLSGYVFRMLLVPNNTSPKIFYRNDNSTTVICFSKF